LKSTSRDANDGKRFAAGKNDAAAAAARSSETAYDDLVGTSSDSLLDMAVRSVVRDLDARAGNRSEDADGVDDVVREPPPPPTLGTHERIASLPPDLAQVVFDAVVATKRLGAGGVPLARQFKYLWVVDLAACGDVAEDDVVETLLRAGADACPNGEKEKNGHHRLGKSATPLHLAARAGALDAVVVLLAGGADPTRVDARGWTPRRLAAECAAREAKTRGSGVDGSSNGVGSSRHGESSERSDRSKSSIANRRSAVDAVLERAEAGTPLLWSRAAHRLYPERFRRDARELLRASWGATRRVRGLAADLVHDEVLRAGARGVWPREISNDTWAAVERVRAAVEARWRLAEARSGRLARGVGLGMGLEFGGLEPFFAHGRYGPLGAFEAFPSDAETATSPGGGAGDARVSFDDVKVSGDAAAPPRVAATSAQCAARREMLNAPAPGTPPESAAPGFADGSVADDDDAMETGSGSDGSEGEDEVQSAPPTAYQVAAAEREAERRHAEALAQAQQHAAMQRELFAMYETQMHLAAALAAQ